MTKIVESTLAEYSNNVDQSTLGKEESVTITPNPEYMADIENENAFDPWTLADKEGKELFTPMDGKTIRNAILKRIPQARKIQLVRKGTFGAMQIVVVCQADYPGEKAAVLIEDDANIYIRHKDLMNIVDQMWSELQKRKKRIKTNQLPADFLRSEKILDLSRHR